MSRPKTVRVSPPRTAPGATDPHYGGKNAFYLVYTNKQGETIRETKVFGDKESPKTYLEGMGLDFRKASVRRVE